MQVLANSIYSLLNQIRVLDHTYVERRVQERPSLQVSVDTESERGLLGIAIMNNTSSIKSNNNNNNSNKVVFLY
jgi:hypothetical protein